MVNDLVIGIKSMVNDIFVLGPTVYGLRSMVYGLWITAYGYRLDEQTYIVIPYFMYKCNMNKLRGRNVLLHCTVNVNTLCVQFKRYVADE